MQMQKKSLSQIKSSSLIIAALVLGAVLGVGGSVFATSIGNSISASTDLTVTGNTGLGTTTPGMVLGVQGVGNFASTGSTVYSTLTFPSFTATSTSATNGIGTTTPGSLLSIQGVGNFVNAATSTLYTDFTLRSVSATSTIYGADGTAAVPSLAFTSDTDTGLFNAGANLLGLSTGGSERVRINASGNFGIGTTTPGTVFSVQAAANFSDTGSTTIYRDVTLPQVRATSTTATSTFSNGILVATSAGSFGIGTTTPAKTLSVAGDALVGGSGTTTLTVNTSSASTGSCIELRGASSSVIYRIYVSGNQSSSTPLMVEVGSCR